MKLIKKRRTAPKEKGPSEHTIQVNLMNYLEYGLRPELECRAIPNGGLRKKSVAIKLKAEGVKAGTPDLFVTLDHGRIGWLEMKNAKGRLLPEQERFRDKVLALDHFWAMAKSVKEALIILTGWDALREEFMVHEGQELDEENEYRVYANTHPAGAHF